MSWAWLGIKVGTGMVLAETARCRDCPPVWGPNQGCLAQSCPWGQK